EEDEDAEVLAEAARQAGEAVSGRHRQQQSNQNHECPDKERVLAEVNEHRLRKQQVDVLEGRRPVVYERVVPRDIQILVLLEHRDHGPGKRRSSEEGKESDEKVLEHRRGWKA